MLVQRILLFVGAALVVALALFTVLRSPEPEKGPRVAGIGAQFMKVLPEDLPPDQIVEIEGLLARFEDGVREGQIAAREEAEVKTLLTKYIDRGSITRTELDRVMARVGYYRVRGNLPDSLGIHPLLEEERDSI